MIRRFSTHCAVVGSCVLLLLASRVLSQDSTASLQASQPAKRVAGMSLERARDRAELLHKVYTATLEVMHERYFHRDRAMVPARAMEDVFDDIKRQERIEARWIAVSLRAMSIDHKPESSFEKHAVSEIKSGKRDVEQTDTDYYRRAFAIPLHGGCVHCHDNSLMPSTTPKFAGLVISIPLFTKDGSDTKPGTE